MGVDFLQRSGTTIAVARDKDRMALVQGDLFTRCIELAVQYEAVQLSPDSTLDTGDEITIEYQADRIVAVSGDRIVGHIANPRQALRDMLDEYGIVGGRVDEVYPTARVAEVEIIE